MRFVFLIVYCGFSFGAIFFRGLRFSVVAGLDQMSMSLGDSNDLNGTLLKSSFITHQRSQSLSGKIGRLRFLSLKYIPDKMHELQYI